MPRLTVRSSALAVALALVIGVAVSTQNKPDFSGRWVLESAFQTAPDIPRVLTVRQPLVRTTARGEPVDPFYRELSVERQYDHHITSETHQIGVEGGVVQGVEPGGRLAGPHLHHAAKWNGLALVLETGSYTGPTPRTGVWHERREVWALDGNGRLRLMITTHGSDGESPTTVVLYRRE